MPQSLSETSLVTNDCPIRMGNSDIVLQDEFGSSDIVLEDEFGNSDLLDVEEYGCINRELVNLENAAVNIDNSNDVIIGPVTQFNVSGNVTIYQNGQNHNEAIEEIAINKEQQSKQSVHDAKLSKFEKTESEEQELKKFDRHKKFIKIISTISLSLVIFVAITVVVIHYYYKLEENSDFVPTEPDDDDDNRLGDHHIFDRTIWNGRPPLSYRNITSPVPMIIVKHTGGGMCHSFVECVKKVQTIQSDCVNRGMPDIYCNFLIGADGNIYVGRGWDVHPQQRDNIIDIVFMGSFAFDKLTSAMIEAAKLLIDDGAKKGKLTNNYKIVAHNQTTTTESPGGRVIEEVRNWPHYDPGYYFSNEVLTTSTSRK